jgi:hypothetical protein
LHLLNQFQALTSKLNMGMKQATKDEEKLNLTSINNKRKK